MILTWTVLDGPTRTRTPPWTPGRARWWQTGHSSRGVAAAPSEDGTCWSVLAGWDDEGQAASAPQVPGWRAWHLVLEPFARHGYVALGDGARPLDHLSGTRAADGAVAVVTAAGPSPSEGREREFFRRFLHVTRDVAAAPAHLVSMVQAPTQVGTQPVLTLSAWQGLTAAADWAYARSRPHAAAVRRQREHGLVTTSGSLRCAIRSSSGDLAGLGDPLAGRQGHVSAAALDR